MNLELLAHKWGLINPCKYIHRYSMSNNYKGTPMLPRDTAMQSFFDLKTIKQAFNRIYMKTFDDQEILIEKEYAISGAKLIQ